MLKQWNILLLKELRQNLHSLSGVVVILLFLIICGCLLWLIPGSYNIPDGGYASLSSFFALAPVLLLVLIPALAMRSLAEERRMQTLILLKSRPVSLQAVVSAKVTALFITVCFALLPTLAYAGCIYYYGNPVGNIDLGATAASYIGLLFLSLAFISLSVFASSLTSNQVIALIIGLLLCALFYYGWNLIGWDALSLLSHYQSVQRGLIETRDLAYFLLISTLLAYLAIFGISSFRITLFPIKSTRIPRQTWLSAALILALIAALLFNFRFDWTKDKRYTIRQTTKELLKSLPAPLEVELYLTGPLNPGFSRLQQSTLHLLSDFNQLSPKQINYRLVDPYRQGRDFIDHLHSHRMTGISVNERSSDGRQTQHILYPYALVKYGDRQIPIPLLSNPMGHSGEDNLNLSGELLEYRFAHAIQLVTQTESRRIVFLEGHGEFPEQAVSEITDRLSYEYSIDRGILSGSTAELNDYKLVIIAGARTAFSETDKWTLDQYLMQGGSLLWLINGANIHSYEDLIQNGETLALPNDLNLNDLFFTYGLRIEPVLLQDAQCLEIPMSRTDAAGQTEYIAQPWPYFPLLTPDSRSEITRDLSLVKAGFSSTITFVGAHPRLKKTALLTSSPYSRTLPLPAAIRLSEAATLAKARFSESRLPVAALLEGIFPSGFQNRSAFTAAEYPDILFESRPAKMIVIASDELITNPLGYDRYADLRFANEDFIVNAVNFLTDTTGLSSLKSKSLQMRLLNKHALQTNRPTVIATTCIAPPLLMLLIFSVLSQIRKRKFSRFT
jgi:ABC-2 type transport system permease protein